MTSKDLIDRFQGTILGCAIGDALGFPYEGIGPETLWERRHEIVAKFTPHPSGSFPLGQFTDDTQLTLALLEAILEAGKVDGQTIAQKIAVLWKNGTIIGQGMACSLAMNNFIIQRMAWNKAGAPEGSAGNGSAMRASPIGLWNFAHYDHISSDSRIQSIVTHQDSRATAGATAVAASVTLNLNHPNLERNSARKEYLIKIGTLVGNVHADFGCYIKKLNEYLSFSPAKAIALIRSTGYTGTAKPDWPGISPYVIPTVLTALFSFLRSPDDFRETVSITIGAGGDVDTTSAIAGALSGAFNGLVGLPVKLRKEVLDGARLISLASTLYQMAIER